MNNRREITYQNVKLSSVPLPALSQHNANGPKSWKFQSTSAITPDRWRQWLKKTKTKTKTNCQCRRRKRCKFNPWVGKIPWRRAGIPLQYSCLENPMDRWVWWATVHGVAALDPFLKRTILINYTKKSLHNNTLYSNMALKIHENNDKKQAQKINCKEIYQITNNVNIVELWMIFSSHWPAYTF